MHRKAVKVNNIGHTYHLKGNLIKTTHKTP